MEESIIRSLADLPFAMLFALFLVLSFRQRQATMIMMADIVREFTKVISDCCDDEDKEKN